nr:hypothetical protein [Tanacetum cinerariifolium]
GIDDDILLTIKDDILCEKLLNVNLLIDKIEALNDNPTPTSDYKTKYSSTSLNSLLKETNSFDDSLPEFETFCFDVEEISSGSTTTHSDSSLYASFIFDLLINPFPPADRSDFYEFADELIHFISPLDKSLFTYVVWIFLPFLVYSVAHHYLLSLRNEDTIFDPGICNSHFSRPDVSHRCRTFPRFKVLPKSSMEIFSSICSPMDK